MIYTQNCLFLVMLVLLGALTLPTRAADEKSTSIKPLTTVSLATLEWPPYSSKTLPDGGETVAKVVSVFRRMGYSARIDFLPWSRAVRSTHGEQPLYLAYFPEYPLTNNQFRLSAPIGHSVVGLVQRKDRTLQLANVQALRHYRLGVVQDYINTDEIDAMITNGTIKPIIAINDRQNIARVINGDIDVAVIDKKVLQYLVSHDKQLNLRGAEVLQFNDHLAQTLSLHLAFNRYHSDSALVEKFNQTLAKMYNGQTLP